MNRRSLFRGVSWNASRVSMRSSGSSSAIRIVIGRPLRLMRRFRLRGAVEGQRDEEGGPCTGCTLRRDLAAVPLDDPPADGQADARAVVLLAAVEPLEDLED